MTKSKNVVRCWVHKDFKKKMKQAAAKNDMTVIEYTEQFGDDEFNKMFAQKQNKKRRKYDFGF